MLVPRYFVIAQQVNGELLYFSDEDQGKWVSDPERAKKFSTFRSAQLWARAHLANEVQVCEAA